MTLQILRLEPSMLGNLLQHNRAKFRAIAESPRITWPSFALKLLVRAAFVRLDWPPNTQKSAKDATFFRAWPRAHRKRIDFGGFFTCSVRSASTRRASAVTFTSASCLVWPYTITPGNSGISAIQRPSSSCSNSIRKDSPPPSGERGSVATPATPSSPKLRGGDSRTRWE
jgi:hypothetical protein